MLNRSVFEELVNTRIGDYVINSFIGAGGQAVVYQAHSQSLGGGAKYALKVFGLLDSVARSLEAGLAEAKKQSQVDHAAVVKVSTPGIEEIDFDGSVRRVLYLPMSFSPLGSCEDEPPFAGRPLTEVDFKVMMNLLDGLRTIHEVGIIHNDIKPANILRSHERIDGEERDNLRITDFGIAKVLEAIGGHMGGASGFTTWYMSPEQIDRRYSANGDIYSMGGTLYHMVTGQTPIAPPADLQNLLAWQEAHRTQPRPDAHGTNLFCPPRLALLIMRMMSVDPSRRPSLDDCIAELRTIITLLHGRLFEFRPTVNLHKALEGQQFPIHSHSEFRGVFKPEVHEACGLTLFVIRLKMQHPVLEQYKWLVRCVSRQFSDSFCMYETWGSYDINMFIWGERVEVDRLVRNLSEQFPGSEPQVAEVSHLHHFHERNHTPPESPSRVFALAVQESIELPGLDPSSYLVTSFPADMPERSIRAFTYVEAVEDVQWPFLRHAIAEQIRARLLEIWRKHRDNFQRMSVLELAPDKASGRLGRTAAIVDFVATEYRYLADVPTTIIESLGESAVRTLTCLETRRIMIQSDTVLL